MILPVARIVAIDDEPRHLRGLTQGLARYGAGCLPILFGGDPDEIPRCPAVRIIFADLNLGGVTREDHAQDFGTIGGLLENSIRPAGPYIIVLWTRFADQAQGLNQFLDRLDSVPKPFAVEPIDKAKHLDDTGNLRNVELLAQAIEKCVRAHPRFGALLNWEERVLGATTEAVSSIVRLAKEGVESDEEALGRLLANFAVEAVGADNVCADEFRAVNEALVPILADRITFMQRHEADDDLWRAALKMVPNQGHLSGNEAARLNRFLHIECGSTGDNGTRRGSVIPWQPGVDGKAFTRTFAVEPEKAAEEQFRRVRGDAQGSAPRWVLVQTQAACDYAQQQPGPLPFHLGLCVPMSEVKQGSAPDALWQSPSFEFEGNQWQLQVNARFTLSWPKVRAQATTPLFRLREQLLDYLIYHVHGYGGRPGIISFDAPKRKKATRVQQDSQSGPTPSSAVMGLFTKLWTWLRRVATWNRKG